MITCKLYFNKIGLFCGLMYIMSLKYFSESVCRLYRIVKEDHGT